MRLNIRAFALTCGLFWGVTLPLLTWWVTAMNLPAGPLLWLTHVYRGYSLTLAGGAIGTVWAFFDGLIGGAVFAWLYDALESRAPMYRRVAG